MLTPYLTLKFRGSTAYGEMSLVYSLIPFLNTLILFGFETAYFRFIQRKEAEKDVYSTLSFSLLTSTAFITAIIFLFRRDLASFIHVQHPEYITFSAIIVGLDALSALPFAKLRHEGRPRKFAAIRITGILINIAFVYFFLSVCPRVVKAHPGSVL